MIVALAVIVTVGTVKAGGIGQVLENARAIPGFLEFFGLATPAMQDGAQIVEAGKPVFEAASDYGLLSVFSMMAWGLGYFGMPHILVRFMSIEKPSQMHKSAAIAIIWVVLAIGGACLVAYLARMVMAEELLTVGAQKTVFIAMARRFFPPAIAGFLLAAIMAASVSTADSQLLVASSSFTADIYKPMLRKSANDRETLMVGRIAVVIIAIIAFMLASSKGSGAQAIMNLVENAWGIFGAAFGPVVILSLFWRRFNYAGACIGVIVGAAVDIIWLFCLSSTGVYELFPGFVAGGIAAIIGTLVTKAPEKAVTDIFDKASDPNYDE